MLNQVDNRCIKVNITWMCRSNLTAVLNIENLCFENPLGEEELLTYLSQRNCIGMVVEHQGKVVAYMVYELFKHHIEILRLAVHPEFQKRSVGNQMIDKLVSKLDVGRRTKLLIKLNERNVVAQVFFKKREFFATNTLRCYFGNDDAYVMEYRISDEEFDVCLNTINRIAQYE